jgi:hypothetical protein
MVINPTTSFNPNTRIRHRKYGEGVVTHVTPEHLKVSFQEGPSRTFAAKVVVQYNLLEVLPPSINPAAELIQFPLHVSSRDNPEVALSIAEEIVHTPRLAMIFFEHSRAFQEIRKFVKRGLEALKRGGRDELRRLQEYLMEAIQPRLDRREQQRLMTIARGQQSAEGIEAGDRWEGFMIGFKQLRRRMEISSNKELQEELTEEIRQDTVMRKIISAAQRVAREMTSDRIGLSARNILRTSSPKSFIYDPEGRAELVVMHIRRVERTWGRQYLSPEIYPDIEGEEVDLLEDRKAVTIMLMVLGRRDLRRRYLNRSLSQTIRSALRGFQNYRCSGSTRDKVLEFTQRVAEELGPDFIPLAKGAGFKIPSYKDVV